MQLEKNADYQVEGYGYLSDGEQTDIATLNKTLDAIKSTENNDNAKDDMDIINTTKNMNTKVGNLMKNLIDSNGSIDPLLYKTVPVNNFQKYLNQNFHGSTALYINNDNTITLTYGQNSETIADETTGHPFIYNPKLSFKTNILKLQKTTLKKYKNNQVQDNFVKTDGIGTIPTIFNNTSEGKIKLTKVKGIDDNDPINKSIDNFDFSGGTLFELSSSILTLEAKAKLKQKIPNIKQALSANPLKKIQLTGYVDGTNNAQLDKNDTDGILSYNRALAIQAELVANGIQKNKIIVTKPTKTDGSDQILGGGKNQQNRKVDFKLV